MSDRYKATVLGKEREVCGCDDQGALVLGNGKRYISPVGIDPHTFRTFTLRSISRQVFKGERFEVMSVRRWRDRVLGAAKPN